MLIETYDLLEHSHFWHQSLNIAKLVLVLRWCYIPNNKALGFFVLGERYFQVAPILAFAKHVTPNAGHFFAQRHFKQTW